VRKKGKGLEFLFVLKKEVTIPPRLGFFDTWKRTGEPGLIKQFNLAIDEALEEKAA
jgi:hypothetical protein